MAGSGLFGSGPASFDGLFEISLHEPEQWRDDVVGLVVLRGDDVDVGVALRDEDLEATSGVAEARKRSAWLLSIDYARRR